MSSPPQNMMDQISEIIEAQIEKRLNEKITKYAEYISVRYDISFKLLLHDLENIENLSLHSPRQCETETNGQCKGVKANGKRCTSSGKNSGYCARHIGQKKIIRTTSSNAIKTIPHNHSFSETLYKVGCPACEQNKHHENSLIDF